MITDEDLFACAITNDFSEHVDNTARVVIFLIEHEYIKCVDIQYFEDKPATVHFEVQKPFIMTGKYVRGSVLLMEMKNE